jgi:hypothetical protein
MANHGHQEEGSPAVEEATKKRRGAAKLASLSFRGTLRGLRPRRRRSRQRNRERIAAQDHERDQPPDSALVVATGPHEFGHAPNPVRPSRFAGPSTYTKVRILSPQ